MSALVSAARRASLARSVSQPVVGSAASAMASGLTGVSSNAVLASNASGQAGLIASEGAALNGAAGCRAR